MTGEFYEPSITSVQVEDSNATLFGHYHTYDLMRPYLDDLGELMESTDQFVWEFPFHSKGFEIGETTTDALSQEFSVDPGQQKYFDVVSEMARSHYDEMWAPDHSGGFLADVTKGIFYLSPLAGAGVGLYIIGKGFKQPVKEVVDFESLPCFPLETGSGKMQELGVGRRQVLKAGGGMLGSTVTGSILYGTSIQENAIQEAGGDSSHGYVLPFTWNDNREVFTAEGIEHVAEENKGDNILCLWGDVHPSSIAGYLEHPEERRFKRSIYKHLLKQPEEEMAYWEDEGRDWVLADKVDLAEYKIR